MPPDIGRPSMSYSPAYYHNRISISPAPSGDHDLPSSHVHQPPAAHLYPQHRPLSPLAASPAVRSSSESGRPVRPARTFEPPQGREGKTLPQSMHPLAFSFSCDAEQSSINHGLGRGAGRGAKLYPGTWETASGQRLSGRDQNMADYDTIIYSYTPGGDAVEDVADHAILVLLWLACLDPFYSLFSALCTIFALIALSIFTPFWLCKSSSSFGISAIRTLGPLLRLHLRLMYAKSAHEADQLEFKAGRLIAILVVSPVVSIGVAMVEWVAAPFWIFAIIMGNPDGTERRDDGRATVLAVRNWWERFLLRAVIR